MTPGVVGGDNSTLKLDLENAPQPEGYLRLSEKCGGRARLREGYLEGAPELIVEVAASSDLHDKLNAYRRNAVRENIVWRTEDREIDWFILRGGDFHRLSLGDDRFYRSEVFPGLRLDPDAVMRGDLARVLKVLHQGLEHPSHGQFLESQPKT